jgi:heat shock protein HtpX
MAHILNGDMVTLTLLQGVMNTFVIFIAHMLSKLVVSLIQGQKDEEEGGMGSYFLYHTIVSIFEMALGLLASLVIMWFSRVREYRADI